MAGRLLRNRILWLALMSGALVVTWRLFKRERIGETRRAKEPAKDVEATRAPVAGPLADPGADRSALGWGPLLTLTRFDVKSVVRSPAFFVLVGITLVNAIIGLWIAGDDTVSITLPVTRLMIQTLFTQFSTYPMVIAAYYAGELVWRDRERRVHEILDATPGGGLGVSWRPRSSRSPLCWWRWPSAAWRGRPGPAGQGLHHARARALRRLVRAAVGREHVLFAVLTVFIQTLVPHKFIGLLVVVLFLAGAAHAHQVRVRAQPLSVRGTSAVPLSDMNGQGNFARHAAWFRAYWTAFAAILTVLAYALWRRGASSPLKSRLQAPAVTPARRAGAGRCRLRAADGRARRVHLLQHQHPEPVPQPAGQPAVAGGL
jgi:hypothetical protein